MQSGAMWSWNVRKSRVWSALAEVDGVELAGCAPADHAAVGAHPGVVAAETDAGAAHRGLGLDQRRLLADLPRRHAELLGGHVTDPCGPPDQDLGDRNHEHAVVGRCLHLEHRQLAVVAGPHHETGEGGRALAHGDVHDHDRARHRDARRDVDDDRVGDEGVVQRHEGVGRVADRRADQVGVVVAGHADVHALGDEPVVDGDRHDPPVGHDDGGGPLGDGVDQRLGGDGEHEVADTGGRGRGEVVEGELVDAAVAPDLLVGRRQRGGLERGRSHGAARLQPGRAVERGRGVRSEGAQRRVLSQPVRTVRAPRPGTVQPTGGFGSLPRPGTAAAGLAPGGRRIGG